MIEKDRITVQIHPALKYELDKRKELLTINHVPNGGLRTASQLAAFELKIIRKSRKELERKFLDLKEPKIIMIGGNKYIRVEEYMKIFNFAASLNKKKDQQQIKADFTKIKGIKKNEVSIFW